MEEVTVLHVPQRKIKLPRHGGDPHTKAHEKTDAFREVIRNASVGSGREARPTAESPACRSEPRDR
jgi:hypothetical protein